MREVQFMGSRVIDRKKLTYMAAMGFMLAVAGCQSGDGAGALNLGGGGAQAQSVDNRPTQEDLLAYCPRVDVIDSAAIHPSYQRGGDGDATKLVYQASLSEATRSCVHQGGMIGMTIAVAGRVIPGPVGTTGTINLPIRVTVFQGSTEISSQVYQHPVSIADTAGATQFVFTDTNVSVPNTGQQNIRAAIGFEKAAR
jgi:hypothetical protein